MSDVICPLWAQCKLGAAVLGAGWSWALKHSGSSLSFTLVFFFFYCEHIQTSGKMRSRFSCLRAAGYPYMQTSGFVQIQNICKRNSNSLRLPHLASVYNGWQSSLVALSLGRLRQGRKHIWSRQDEGNTCYSFRQSKFCAGGRILAGTFPGDVYIPRQRFAGSERCLVEQTNS